MKKTFYFTTLLVAAITTLWGCSSSDDDEKKDQKETSYIETQGSEDLQWVIDWKANDAAPNWQMPKISNFENWAILMIKLQPELASYSTNDDMMAVLINDEVRGVAHPATDVEQGTEYGKDNNIFILKVYGNDIANKTLDFTLKYYSAYLHQVFSLTGKEKFVPEKVYGVDEDFVPPLTQGSSKYPVVMNLNVTAFLGPDSGFKFSEGDMLGVFVGDECRGIHLGYSGLLSQPVTLPVYGKQEGEVATIRYYNAEKNVILSFKQSINISAGNQSYNINI